MSEERMNVVPTLVNLAFNAFTETEYTKYCNLKIQYPIGDFQYCCNSLLEIISLNMNNFHQDGDRRLMFSKLRAIDQNRFKYVCRFAARIGHIECLKLAHQIGLPLSQMTYLDAAKAGNLDCLMYLHDNGCRWGKAYRESMRHGHLDCLKYALTIERPRNEDVLCSLAAYFGQLECLMYLHQKGYRWDARTCKKAAVNGNLECLKYARENGCDWDESTCRKAAANGHLDCLKYAHENGCVWNEFTYIEAVSASQLECVHYAYMNGCPLPQQPNILNAIIQMLMHDLNYLCLTNTY